MSPTCPLCGSASSEELFSVESKALADLYVLGYGPDIRPFMPTEPTLHLIKCLACDLRFFTGGVPGPAEFYRILQQHTRYYLKDKNEYNVAIGYIRNAGSVLEIGPGSGEFGRKLKQQGVAKYTGLELSPEAAAMGRQDALDIRVEHVRDHALSHRQEYDVVCSFQVLEHVPDPKEFLQAATACVRPGGLVILSVPSDDSYIALLPNLMLNMPPHHQTRWTDRCLHQIASLFELDMVSIVHDTVWPEHVGEYARLLAQMGLCDLMGVPVEPIARSFRYRLLARFANTLGKIVARGLRKSTVLLPNGHSVTAVYRRTDGEAPAG